MRFIELAREGKLLNYVAYNLGLPAHWFGVSYWAASDVMTKRELQKSYESLARWATSRRNK